MNISVLILAKNEQEMMPDCLKQLNFASEIIILDQYSSDDTVKIAKKYTDKIFKSNSKDFSENRNILLSYATCDWVLYLDSDERLSPKGIAEIEEFVKSPKFDAYYFPRKNFVLGTYLNHGGWWPDYAPRLFKRKNVKKWYGKVHETPAIIGTFGYAEEPINHLTARSVTSMLEKTIKWAKIEADLAYTANHPKVAIIKVIKAMLFEFGYRYIKKLGVLDGRVGLIEAIFQALHKAVYLTYLWELQNKTQEKTASFKK